MTCGGSRLRVRQCTQLSSSIAKEIGVGEPQFGQCAASISGYYLYCAWISRRIFEVSSRLSSRLRRYQKVWSHSAKSSAVDRQLNLVCGHSLLISLCSTPLSYRSPK